MIFLALGTQKFQCNRLLKKIDDLKLSGVITDTVFAQVGHSDYIPKTYECVKFLNKEEFDEKINECSLLITHSGVGTILSGINHKKPIIVFPRLKKYKEHVDDHQLDIARAFSQKDLVLMCGEDDDLSELIMKSKTFSFGTYVSQRENVIRVIENFLTEEIKDV